MKASKARTILCGAVAVSVGTLGLLALPAPAVAHAPGFSYPAITWTAVHSGQAIARSPITQPSPVLQSSTSTVLWNLQAVGSGRSGATQYRVVTGPTGTLCLAPGFNTAVGAALDAEPCAASSVTKQNWRVTTSSQGGATIATLVHVESGLVAGVRAASTAANARLELQQDAGAAHQRFVQRQVAAVVVPDIHDTVAVALALFTAVHAQNSSGINHFILLQLQFQTTILNIQAATIQQNQIDSFAAYQQAMAAAQTGILTGVMMAIFATIASVP